MTTSTVGEGHIRAAENIVVGAANQDYIVRVPAPPRPGETVLATGLLKQRSGKGANQAVARSRLGGAVNVVDSVHDDDDGALLIRELRSVGGEAFQAAVKHLLSRGARRVATIGGRRGPAQSRIAGYEAALLATGLRAQQHLRPALRATRPHAPHRRPLGPFRRG
jgi:sugar/nucleoside kinase (ribokinase family)